MVWRFQELRFAARFEFKPHRLLYFSWDNDDTVLILQNKLLLHAGHPLGLLAPKTDTRFSTAYGIVSPRAKKTTVRFIVGFTVGLQMELLHWFPIKSEEPIGGLVNGQCCSCYLLYWNTFFAWVLLVKNNCHSKALKAVKDSLLNDTIQVLPPLNSPRGMPISENDWQKQLFPSM